MTSAPLTGQPLKKHVSARLWAPGSCRSIARLLFLFALVPWNLRAQAQPETIGRIEGEDIAIKGAAGVEVEGGRSTTVLASGSEVTVRSGQARLVLVEGGEIGVCAPAHFSLLKSGGAITLALDYGRIHARLETNVTLTVYTPLIMATPVTITGRTRDATVGLETTGAMCVLAARGAVRIEQQLTGQSLLVPQGGEVALAGGQIESSYTATGRCQCEALSARASPPPQPKSPELSVPVPVKLARPINPPQRAAANEDLKPPAVEEPIYKVIMPPLTFDAAAPLPPPAPSPETILLVREVRVSPEAVFRGRVESPPPPTPPAAQPLQVSALADKPPEKKQASVVSRIGHFFRRIFSPGRCAGTGCG